MMAWFTFSGNVPLDASAARALNLADTTPTALPRSSTRLSWMAARRLAGFPALKGFVPIAVCRHPACSGLTRTTRLHKASQRFRQLRELVS